MKKNIPIIVALVILILPRTIISAELTILTENLPPLNFIKNGVLMGPAVDIVKEIQKKESAHMNKFRYIHGRGHTNWHWRKQIY